MAKKDVSLQEVKEMMNELKELQQIRSSMNERTTEIADEQQEEMQQQQVQVQQQFVQGFSFSLTNLFKLLCYYIMRVFVPAAPPNPMAQRRQEQSQVQQAEQEYVQHKKTAESSEMGKSLENVIAAVMDANAAQKALKIGLKKLGSPPENMDTWAFNIRKEKDGTVSMLFQNGPDAPFKPFLEGIPTIEDAENVREKVSTIEMDRISRAGRILEYVGNQQGLDGVRIRKRFTSAATYAAMTGQDWTTPEFAESFVPYLEGNGPVKAETRVPTPPRDEHTQIVEDDGCPVPPPPKKSEFIFAPEPTALNDALIEKMMKMGIVANDDHEEELELAAAGPRM